MLILLLIIWQLLVNFELINTFISSSPKKVIETIISLHEQQNLYHHIWITVYETVISFGIGTILGTFIAILLWWNNFLYKVSR